MRGWLGSARDTGPRKPQGDSEHYPHLVKQGVQLAAVAQSGARRAAAVAAPCPERCRVGASSLSATRGVAAVLLEQFTRVPTVVYCLNNFL